MQVLNKEALLDALQGLDKEALNEALQVLYKEALHDVLQDCEGHDLILNCDKDYSDKEVHPLRVPQVLIELGVRLQQVEDRVSARLHRHLELFLIKSAYCSGYIVPYLANDFTHSFLPWAAVFYWQSLLRAILPSELGHTLIMSLISFVARLE